MDVDNDDGIAETEDSMSVDSEGNPPEETKKSKLKPRKSQLNMEALTQEQAAVAALEADEILRLRLKKKYYAEALSFIRLIENSMELMVQLLGSTNKAEVLETMEFFRLAHRYEMEGTKV
jgi:condensin complex subunit 1